MLKPASYLRPESRSTYSFILYLLHASLIYPFEENSFYEGVGVKKLSFFKLFTSSFHISTLCCKQ